MLIKNKYFLILIFFVIISSIPSAYAQGKAISPLKNNAPKESGKNTGSKFTYDSKDKRDPFAALVSHDGRFLEPPARRQKAGDILIEGIIYDAQGASYTVINAEVHKPGDVIGEYQILRIERQKVIFWKAGKEFEVELKKED